VGRLSVGAENIDLDACERAGVEVVRPATASASAEAEFAIGALLQMLRRVPVLNAEGLLVGRELGGTTVGGLVGMTPAAAAGATLLRAFGAEVLGYDPGVHATDRLWARWGCRAGAAARADGADLRRGVRAAALLQRYHRPVRRPLPGRVASPTRCW
jgi:D-3-phosphoglycerate dehydrogenase